MNLQEQLCDWENIRLAYQNASRGKRGRGATAAFEMLLADNLPIKSIASKQRPLNFGFSTVLNFLLNSL